MTNELQNTQLPLIGISDAFPAVDITPFVKAGTDFSPVPATKLFDDARDNILIAAGTHFFCRGHLRAVPMETQSSNPDYCRQCFDVLELERRRDKDSDTWAGEVFVHHNKRYSVKAFVPKSNEPSMTEIKTYCLGGSKPQPLNEKLTTTPLQAVKAVAMSRTTTTGDNSATSDRKCVVCGKPITWGRKGVKYCGDPCERKAAILRKSEKDSVKCGI